MPISSCDCDKSRELVVHLQKLKLFQFLMRLNGVYIQARSQVLLMSPLPIVNQAYAMILSDETHKSVVNNAGILDSNLVMNSKVCDVAMYSRNAEGNGRYQRFKKNYNVQCEFCKMKVIPKITIGKSLDIHQTLRTRRSLEF